MSDTLSTAEASLHAQVIAWVLHRVRMGLLRACIGTLLVVVSGGAVAQATAPVRAIFDEGLYWALPSPEVDRVLERVQAAGFNTYIPCVWHGQGATWKSTVAPVWAANPALAQRDAFRAFLNAAHKRGLKVLPCFTLALRQAEILPQFTSESRPEGVFDVQNSEFRKFWRELVVEFVSRYDVDGLNLDYVRTGQVCYDARCRKLYSEATGRNLMVDLAAHKVSSAAMDAIVGWQRTAVGDLVKGVVDAAKGVNPKLLITVDAAPWAESVIIEGQESLRWADAGIVDLVLSMNYEKTINWSAMGGLQKRMLHPDRFAVMIGNYDGEPPNIKSRSGALVARLVSEAESFNPNGSYAVYIYSLMTDEQVSSLAARRSARP